MLSNSLRHSTTIQLRVIHALVMREVITRYGRKNIGFLWLLIEPVLFTLGVTALWTLLKASHSSNLPIVAFAITGYSSVLLWRNASGRCLKSLEPNFDLLYHRNVKILDIFLARIILEIIGATFSCVALSLAFIGANLMNPPEDILFVIFGWGLLSWFAVSLGLTIGVLSEMSDLFDRMWHVFTYLIFPLSGAGFLVDWMPGAFREYLYWIPMVHGTEIIRAGYFGALIRSHYDMGFLCIVNSTLLCIGLSLVSRLRRTIQPP